MNEVSDSCSNWFLDFLEINSSNNDKGLDFSATFYVRLGLSSEVVYIVYHPSYEYDAYMSENTGYSMTHALHTKIYELKLG